MKILTEKEKFSARLQIALNSNGFHSLKTSEIATKFNLRHPNEPVTPQAVHKWLNGLAIPSKDKITTLAQWLKVNTDWLRYGVSENGDSNSPLDETLIGLIKGLNEQQKSALITFISAFEQHPNLKK